MASEPQDPHAEWRPGSGHLPAWDAGRPAARRDQPARSEPESARQVNWRLVLWGTTGLLLVTWMVVIFFFTVYGSFFVLMFAGFIASGLIGSPGPQGTRRRRWH